MRKMLLLTGFFIGYLWALPITLIAGLLALLTWSKPQKTYRGAVVLMAGPLAQRWLVNSGMAAFTWGGFVFCAHIVFSASHAHDFDRLLTHETTHFQQARIFGIFLPLLYALGSLICVANGSDPYEQNFLEVWARAMEKR